MGTFENALPEFAVFTQLDRAINWAKQGSLGMLFLDLACCGVEMTQVCGGRYDIERFGSTIQTHPRHADLMIVAGTITHKIAKRIQALYHEMPQSKYVMALGSCTSSGSPFSWEQSYSTVCGADKLFPVDVYVPGCPPRPEAILHGLLLLQKKISNQKILVQNERRVER